MTAAIHQFKSHIEGKNADVAIYPDRVEWGLSGGMSGGKLAGAALTGGLSLAKTGLRKKQQGSEVIPVKAISSVTTEKDGFRYTKVRVLCTGNTIDFRVGHDEAPKIKALLVSLMLGNHPTQQASAAPAPAAPPAAPASDDRMAKLRELAQMRDDGILTEDEFAAEKAKLLG